MYSICLILNKVRSVRKRHDFHYMESTRLRGESWIENAKIAPKESLVKIVEVWRFSKVRNSVKLKWHIVL